MRAALLGKSRRVNGQHTANRSAALNEISLGWYLRTGTVAGKATVRDLLKKGVDGTVVGTPGVGSCPPGSVSPSLITGTGNYVDFGTSTAIRNTLSYAASMWFNVTTLASTDVVTLFSWGYNGSVAGLFLGWNTFSGGPANNTGKLNFGGYNGANISGCYGNTDFSSAGNKGKWFHVVAGWNGAAWTLLINGQSEANVYNQSTLFGPNVSTGAKTFWGAEYSNGSIIRYFPGLLADLRILSPYPSAAHIASLYGAGPRGYAGELNRPVNPLAFASPSGGPFPWFLDQSHCGGFADMGLS